MTRVIVCCPLVHLTDDKVKRWKIGCFRLNISLRQYSQTQGEKMGYDRRE